MGAGIISRKPVLIFWLSLFSMLSLKAADESYIETLTGKIKKGDSVTVVDDKFKYLSLAQWNQVRNISVENVISFELRNDTAVYFQRKPFSCTLRLSIHYFTSRDQQQPTEIKDISLVVRYDTATGSFYAVDSSYRFKDAFKVLVKVDSISSPEFGDSIPAVFRIKNQIFVKRQYPFSTIVQAPFQWSLQSASPPTAAARVSVDPVAVNRQLHISWSSTDFQGAEIYDVEWTFIDGRSKLAGIFETPGTITDEQLAEWMKDDNTRVTLGVTSYDINLPYASGYVLVRVRGACFDPDYQIRRTTNWQYRNSAGDVAFEAISGHQPGLNWQYTGSFAEEGKRKEVMSYYDASLRSRQNVTINTGDDGVAVVGETVYDNMGRVAASILPAPAFENELKFYDNFNRNEQELPYSYADITGGATTPNLNICNIQAGALSTSRGASKYYSPTNAYLNASNPANAEFYFAKYIPDAAKFPLSVTEYVADNTGRIRRQGGVGPLFQIGRGQETMYYYGKPLQTELYRMFGSEVGNASHYLKNVVVDGNGQISVSYVNAAGKTIATALAGNAPVNTNELASASKSAAKVRLNQQMIKTDDFQKDAASLLTNATSTFFAAVTGDFKLHYSLSPASLLTAPAASQQFCTNCYYDVLIQVKDECGGVVKQINTSPISGNDIVCHTPANITDSLEFSVSKIGEYTIVYTLRLSESVINSQTDYYIEHNSDLTTLQQFFHNEVFQADLKACYGDCATCITKLGTAEQFATNMTTVLLRLKDEKYQGHNFDVYSDSIQLWLSQSYETLLQECYSKQFNCGISPCERKLDMMKNDVRPGGQYALFSYDPTTQIYAYTERDINVLRLYNNTNYNLYHITYTSESGTTVEIGTLSETDFIKAYLAHPEWADEFVHEHVEYCSYLWCKDVSYPNPYYNNEASYRFDEMLKEQVVTGEQAANIGFYYSGGDPLQLLQNDPFFNGGRGDAYRNDMQNDMLNCSDVLHMTPNGFYATGTNTNKLAVKNIAELVDWALYCKPNNPNVDEWSFVDSWNYCVVQCRSSTNEWGLYRTFYLQLKAKYMALAKAAGSPSCINCFIGNDGLSGACVGSNNGGIADPANCAPVTISDNAFLKGNFAEVGIAPSGVFGSTVGAPLGFHPRTGDMNDRTLGFVANAYRVPNWNSWVGDYFLPGVREEGFGVTVNGTSYNNNGFLAGGEIPITGNFICTQNTTAFESATWRGIANGQLQVNAQTYLPVDALYFVTKVTLTNISGSNLDNIFYMRNVDPDHGVLPDGNSHATKNQILSSGTAGALVGSKSLQNHFLGLGSLDSRARAAFGGFSNRSAQNIWQGIAPSTLSGNNGTNGLDDAISISFNVGTLAPGQSTTFSYAYILNENDLNIAMAETAPPPASSCPGDARYATKMRIWDEYANTGGYLNCAVGTMNPEQSRETSAVAIRDQALLNLDVEAQDWSDKLKAARDEETATFGTITNTTIDQLVVRLKAVAAQNIQLAYAAYNPETGTPDQIRSASTVPVVAGVVYVDFSFRDAFNAIIGTSLVNSGFGPDLLAMPYPHDKTPVLVGPSTGDLNTDICGRLTLLHNRFLTTGQTTDEEFHNWVKQELGDEYVLSLPQLQDMMQRCNSWCQYLENPLQLPALFAVVKPDNADHPWISCTRMDQLMTLFANAYPTVTNTQSKLYRVLFTNFLNHSLGYSLAYEEYIAFKDKCLETPSIVLYNKPASPNVVVDELACQMAIMAEVFTKAGQEYEYYVEIQRRIFRNELIATCLSSGAGAKLEGDQYEYHYTLYYYDQAGNLVKTISPEGVHLLTDDAVKQVDKIAFSSDVCQGTGIPNSQNNPDITFSTFSSELSSGVTQPKAFELWMHNESASGVLKQVRIVTPDYNYVLQVAIKNNFIWAELHQLSGLLGSVSIVHTSRAVANLSEVPVTDSWIHLVAQNANGLLSGDLQLYLNGARLRNIVSPPAYPEAWPSSPFGGGTMMPAQVLTSLKHFRWYNRVVTVDEALSNYANSCMKPVGNLASSSVLKYWSALNVPVFCGPAATPVEVASKGELYVHGGSDNYNYYVDNAREFFTVECWVNPADYITMGNTGWVSSMEGQSFVTYPVALGGSLATLGISVGVNGIRIYENEGQWICVPISLNLPINGWTHIAVTRDGDATRNVKLYVNGVQVAHAVSLLGVAYPSYSIGGQHDRQSYYDMDELRIWNYTRTASEIYNNYSKPIANTEASGLVGYWPMNSEDGLLIKDITCNARHVPLSGASSYDTYYPPVPEYEYVQDSRPRPFLIPRHTLPVLYGYNSQNEVVRKVTPDAGLSEFLYDRLGRLSFSQNAEQALPIFNLGFSKKYSYTKYDRQSRITETGEKLLSSAYWGFMSELPVRDTDIVKQIHNLGTNTQVVVTTYDETPVWAPAALTGMQHNLRKRASAIALLSSGSNGANNRTAASYYSYDVSGNVSDLVQEDAGYHATEASYVTGSDGLKRIRYEYDLISGKVNKVLYQDGKWDQFYQQYLYDADNRLIKVLSSRNNYNDLLQWVPEATYRYYPHGPLARLELGKNQVQGLDYAYTLQGWLKGINGNFLDIAKDMSNDSDPAPGKKFAGVARDAFGFSLGYYTKDDIRDYTPIGGTAAPAFGLQYQAVEPDPTGEVRSYASGLSLYNGNISNSTYAISGLESAVGYTYRYDQLNRLIGFHRHGSMNSSVTIWGNNTILPEFKEAVDYDGNGNIRNYVRAGNAAQLQMDRLRYEYNLDESGFLANNRLRHIKDTVPAGNYSIDIDDQGVDNYIYDRIGNLKKDVGSDISNITWTLYRKINTITKTDGTTISYGYDAGGKRILKTVVPLGNLANSVTTYYTRDAQGNVLAVYDKNSSRFAWREQHLYGSSRLGMVTPNKQVQNGATIDIAYTTTGDPIHNGVEGKKFFELTNHLGTVLVTVSDKKISHSSNGTTIDYYNPDVVTARDYYPFGMLMPGRSFGSSASGGMNLPGTTVTNTTTVNGHTVPVDMVVSSRPEDHLPAEYAASNSIEIVDGFDSGMDDEFVMYITDASYAGTANQGGASGGGQLGSDGTYRYGFNGKENDNEIKGEGDQLDFGERIYDPRIGRFLSVDPACQAFPWYTPYQYAGDNPIAFIDVDGEAVGDGSEKYRRFGVQLSPAGAGFVDGLMEGISFIASGKLAWNLTTDKQFRDQFIDAIKTAASNPVEFVKTIAADYANKFKNILEGNEEGQYEMASMVGEFVGGAITGGAAIKFINYASKFKVKVKISMPRNQLNFGVPIPNVQITIKRFPSSTGKLGHILKKARAYQEQISGGNADIGYKVGNRTFDGYDKSRNVLLEAKFGHGDAIFDSDLNIKAGNAGQRAAGLLKQAKEQIQEAGGTPIEWHISSENGAEGIKKLFEDNGIDKSKLSVKYTAVEKTKK